MGNSSALTNRVISQIEFELGQIEQLFEAYVDLLDRRNKKKPDLVEITALASILHSFYNGLENIFLSIPKVLMPMFLVARNGIVIY
jgi:hypothetical protein